tara:strand:- start:485 stop:1015 length:531 start_codon:yes stop_codon:yes gene_type:complete
MDNLDFKYLFEISFEQFEFFLNSLDEEKESWSLDLQAFKDAKELYDNSSNLPFVIVCMDKKLVVGLVSVNLVLNHNIQNDEEFTYFKDNNFKSGTIISFVVKKEYQGKNIGTELLMEMENAIKKFESNGFPMDFEFIFAKHFKDNIGSHKAFLKAGYKEVSINGDNDFNWKVKELK